jgi:hypothetical protein
MRATSLALSVDEAVPVGAYIEIEAQTLDAPDGGLDATATGTVAEARVATARGTYQPI